MANLLQAIRGMNDILPEEMAYWQYLEKTIRALVSHYGYQEIRTPAVEKTELFTRSIGDITDIVEKEMYTFLDRNNDSLTLRPEGTAGCVRAGIEHGLLYNQIQRLWYISQNFRHERPQKGRYRQFYQFGVEAFGIPGPDIDAELILMGNRLWKQLGLQKEIQLQLNSLGTVESRMRYREHLVDYFTQHQTTLDQDSQRRLTTNPLRILDSKNPAMQDLIAHAPLLTDYLDEPSQTHFSALKEILDDAGVSYTLNPHLVRGLDYYTHTVFEWATESLGAQGTLCAGGRYDGLVEQLGGKSTPAIGFAMGFERVIELIKLTNSHEELASPPDVYLILAGEKAQHEGLILAEQLRDTLPDCSIETNCGGGSFKSQFKKADKSRARIALILGDAELETNTIGIKYLREKSDQEKLPRDKLVAKLQTWCK